LNKHVYFVTVTATKDTFISHDSYCSIRQQLMLP